jgi:DNA polymerase III delta prime subunit
MDYDFSQLNDKEFEIFVVDLLSIAYDVRIERFKTGKDRGVDGRFFTDSGKEICVQCKHYLKSGYRVLISKLKNEESKKVKKLNPAKYIFVTSLPLSRDNKEEIKTIFHPYIKRSDDIFGQEDLNDLLVKNPKVEENHFKLWISNITVFNRIINNAIKGRSEFEIEQIKNKSFKYIKTNSHDIALKILNEKHVLLISGEPGIGKTTLAENLCLFFASKDYEFIDIEESLSEAENIYVRGKKQIFYFDDFLGSNYFEAIENKKDSHIVKFIERIKNDKAKRFILTSRTNVLNSGILYSSIFANSKIQNNEFMLTINKLTLFDRAMILYNHIWFSKLTEDFIDEYYKDKRYKEIIKHKNFNPRLIEFITDIERLNVSNSSLYWSYIVDTLNNPKDIWGDCFKIQNNAYVRNLVKLTVFNGGTITEPELENSFYSLNKIEKLRNPSHTEKDFKSTSQLSSKSFLNRNRFFNEETYSLFNPSIADFVLSEYGNDFENLANIFKSLNTVKSLERLIALEREQIISQEHIFKLKNVIFEDAFKGNKKLDYLIFISDLIKDDDSKKATIYKLLTKIIQEPSPITEFSKLLGLLMLYSEDLNLSDYSFLLSCINDRNLDEYEIEDLAEFLETLEIDDESIFDKLKSDLEVFLSEEMDSTKSDVDMSKFITFPHRYDEDYNYNYDSDGIESELSSIISQRIDDFYSDIIRNLNIDFQKIIDTIDIDQMVSDFISSQVEPDIEGYHGSANTFDRDIDDLFERS